MTTGEAHDGRKRLLWTLALVAWVCVVWGHSMVPADLSAEESSRFLFLVRPLFGLFGSSDEGLMTHVIRKTAHFLEYVVLMAIGSRTARAWFDAPRSRAVLLGVIWVVIPCVDEFIQTFVPARDGNPSDVLLDMAGGVAGLLLARAIARRRDRPEGTG